MHMYKICHKNAQCGFLTQTKHLLTSEQYVGWSYAPFWGCWSCILPLFFAKTTKNHPKSPRKGYLIEIYVLMFMSMND